MAEMTPKQRLWFAGVVDATLDVRVIPMEGPRNKYTQLVVRLGPFGGRESVADRLVDFLGNGWVQDSQGFELRGYAACRGLFEEVWKDITSDTRRTINNALKYYKAQSK